MSNFFIKQPEGLVMLNDVKIKEEEPKFQCDNEDINLPCPSSSVVWLKTENISTNHWLKTENISSNHETPVDVEADAFNFQHVSLLN